MASDYTITAFNAGDFRDQNGNVWCEAAFAGVSEPVRWVMRPESTQKYHVGDVVYGHIEDATSKAGKPYNRFKTDKREDYQSQPKSQPQGSSVPHSSQSTDESIARAVALKAAVESTSGDDHPDKVLELAETYLAWLKNDGGSHPSETKVASQPAAPPSGYDLAKQARDNLNQDPEVQSLMDYAGEYNGEEYAN